jgi:hypothetical protein
MEATCKINNVKSTPLENSKSTPLALSTWAAGGNQYVSSDEITKLAIQKYKTKCGRGISYRDLLETGLAKHKGHAQDMLKYYLRKGTLFTLQDRRPQQYYPTAIKSDIIESMQKSTQIDPRGSHPKPTTHFQKSPC